MKQYAVIGLGRFGSSVARTLNSMGKTVLAIDSDQERINEMLNHAAHCVQADSTDIDSLKALGLRNFDVAIVAIGDDLESSILTTALLKELGVPLVIAKANDEMKGKVLEKVGADRIIYPERDMGIRLAHNILASNIMDYLDFAPGYTIMEVGVSGPLAGKTLAELKLRSKYGINVVAIKKNTPAAAKAIKKNAPADNVVISPGPEAFLEEGDILIAIGKEEALRGLSNDVD